MNESIRALSGSTGSGSLMGSEVTYEQEHIAANTRKSGKRWRMVNMM